MSTDAKVDSAFHSLEFAYLVRDCGGMTSEVEAFGRAMCIDVDALKKSYALESYGSKTLEQVAMEGVWTAIHTWIVEKKRDINTILTVIGAGTGILSVAASYKLGLLNGPGELRKAVAFLAIGVVAGFVERRVILGLFNSLPGAIKAALAIKLPTSGSEMAEYKKNVEHALKIRVWKEATAKAAATKSTAEDKYSADNPPSADEVKSALTAVSESASTAKNLEFVPNALEAMAQTTEAKTPAGAAALRWTTTVITNMIDDAGKHAGKIVHESTRLKDALEKHKK